MFKDALNQMKTAFIALVFLTVLTGFIYPLAVTAIAQLCFPWQANGSLIEQKGKTIGSVLIGQHFSSPNYFWGRPSATAPYPYNGEASSGSNSGPSNPDFLATVRERVEQLKKWGGGNNKFVPVDLVTASGSGLDPEISPMAAFYQVPRVAQSRNRSEMDVIALIERQINRRTFELLGEPRVNVLQLNIALDHL